MKSLARTKLVSLRGDAEAEPTVKTSAAEPTGADTLARNAAYLAECHAFQDCVAREFHAMMAGIHAARTWRDASEAERNSTRRQILRAACERVKSAPC